jgi:hypothetical protein
MMYDSALKRAGSSREKMDGRMDVRRYLMIPLVRGARQD